MKFRLLLLLLVAAFCANAQNLEWGKHRFNNQLEAEIPLPVDSFPTEYGTTYRSSSMTGDITISINSMPGEENTRLNQASINEALKGFVDGITTQQHATLTDSSGFSVGQLKGKEFRFLTERAPQQVIDGRVLFIRGRMYAFIFSCQRVLLEGSKEDRDRFFNSLKANPALTSKDQGTRSNNDSLAYNLGYHGFYLLFVVLALGGLIFLVIRLTR